MTTLTWETAADWDAAQSESGVVHESVANTDHDDDTVVKKGYSAATPYRASDLLLYYPLHEDSGSTANDFSGNARDGTISGPTLNQPGLLGTTAYEFDGTDDEVDVPDGILSGGQAFTHCLWFQEFNNSTDQGIYGFRGDVYYQARVNRNGNGKLSIYSGINYYDVLSPCPENTWIFLAVTYDGSGNWEAFVDGVSQNTWNETLDTRGDSNVIGVWNSGGSYFPGKIWDYRLYDGVLPDSDIQALYDIVDTPGDLTTASKTA